MLRRTESGELVASEPDFSETIELPRELPPEPDVDDVRWDAPLPGSGLRIGGGGTHGQRAAEQPAGQPTHQPSAAQPAAPADDVVRDDVVRGDAGTADEPAVDEGTRGQTSGTRSADAPAAPPAPTFEEAVTDPGADSGAATSVTGADEQATWPVGGPLAGGSPFPSVSEAELDPGFAPRPVGRPAGGGVPVGGAPSAGLVAAAGTPSGRPAELPTLDDLLARRPEPPSGPAEMGWQATVRRLTGGMVAPGPGGAEQRHRRAVAAVQRSLDGPKTVVVINPKGGAHKTTATLLIAATFGIHRGGYTLAWDNNETRGTLGWRSQQARHHNTAVNLLQDLDRFADHGAARVGDLDNYVRSQRSARFDVLASDEDAASAASIDAYAFRSLHRTLSRFYRVMVVDTGNNMRATNWQAAVEAADQVVIVSTVREDTAQSAAWAVDALRATGHEDVVRKAVTVLSAPAPRRDDELAERLHEHFGRLTRAVLDVPYDSELVAGTPLDYEALSRQTKEAWLHVTAAIAEGV